MQIVIDISNETPAALRLAAKFLSEHALLRELIESGEGVPMAPPAPAPAPVVDANAAAADFVNRVSAAAHIAPPPVEPVRDPRDSVFRGHSDAAPPAPIAPPAPAATATAPATSTVSPISAPVSANSSTVPAGAPTHDKSGIPYDARIHQKTGNRKKDGTWKVQKGLDAAVVAAVMQELSTRINVAAGVRQFAGGPPDAPVNTPSPAGASAPVVLPQVPPPPTGSPIAPPPPGAQASQGSDQTPGASGPAASPYRALLTKITQARNAGRLSPEEVTQAWSSVGAPSIQALNALPHLIPAVEQFIDELLATR